VSVVNYI